MINVLWLLILFVAIPLKAEIRVKDEGEHNGNSVYYRYDDVTMKVKEICAVMSNPEVNLCLEMERGGGQGAPIAKLFLPNPPEDPFREVCVAVPQTGQQAINLFINSKGGVDGFTARIGPFLQNTLHQNPQTPCKDF